jgi:hypothetical protein
MVRAGGVLMQKLRRLGLAILLIGTVALGGCFLFPNHPPVASITITPSEDPLVFDLDASGSTDADGDEIVAYMWSFGDDDVEIITPPGIDGLVTSATVTEELITVNFRFEGKYDVTLVVKDAREMLSVPLTVEITVPLPEE